MSDPIFDLYDGLDHLAPGSPASTRRALALVPALDRRRCVVELGCGTGAATLTLAERLDATVVAVDLHPPFVERLRERARARGLDRKIDARVADMREPGVADASVDLLWSEGALYSIGFERGCDLCRRAAGAAARARGFAAG